MSTTEAIKIGKDFVDWEYVDGKARLRHVYTGAGRRILRIAYRRRYPKNSDDPANREDYLRAMTEIKRFLPEGQNTHMTGEIFYEYPGYLKYQLTSQHFIIIPGRLNELEKICNVCGRFGRLKCFYCPVRYCSHNCAEKTTAEMHTCKK